MVTCHCCGSFSNLRAFAQSSVYLLSLFFFEVFLLGVTFKIVRYRKHHSLVTYREEKWNHLNKLRAERIGQKISDSNTAECKSFTKWWLSIHSPQRQKPIPRYRQTDKQTEERVEVEFGNSRECSRFPMTGCENWGCEKSQYFRIS